MTGIPPGGADHTGERVSHDREPGRNRATPLGVSALKTEGPRANGLSQDARLGRFGRWGTQR